MCGNPADHSTTIVMDNAYSMQVNNIKQIVFYASEAFICKLNLSYTAIKRAEKNV